MKNQNLLRGLLLMAIALAFGLGAFRYRIGTFGKAGPGLFPLMISILLFAIGVIAVVRARFVDAVPMRFPLRTFSLILLSLIGFATVSRFVNMTAGIVFMVFCASFAGHSFSTIRNLKIAAGMLVVAFAMQKLLGLDLPLL